MPRLRSLPSVALTLVTAQLFGACQDAVAPQTGAAEMYATAGQVPLALALDPSGPVIDAADRLTVAVEEVTIRSELEAQLRDLAAAWSTGRLQRAQQKLAVARRLVKLAGEKALANAADLDAIQLALDEAEHHIGAQESR